MANFRAKMGKSSKFASRKTRQMVRYLGRIENDANQETRAARRLCDKFRQAAHELSCDEDESAFDEMVKKVAKAPPARQEKKPKMKKR